MCRAQVSEIGGLKMRYFFHVLDGSSAFQDEAGTVLSGPEVARLQAAVIAAELAQAGVDYQGFVVYAVDEQGNEITRVPVVVANEGNTR
jgi:hypothetical protein